MKVRKVNIGAGSFCATAVVALAIFAGSAKGAVWTFNNCSNSGVNATCAAGSGLIARGVSNTNGGTIDKASAVLYAGGLGVSATGEPTSSPNHAIDNNGFVDALFLQFNSQVDLDAITIGWSQTDADISLFRYTGGGNPWNNGNSGDLLGRTYGNLTSSGWAFVGSYADLAVNSARAVNAGDGASKYWLISAYTSLAGSGCNALPNSGATCTDGNDYFKVLSLTTSTPPLCGGTTGIACASTVPEPGTAALLSIALASGLMLRGRRRSPQ